MYYNTNEETGNTLTMSRSNSTKQEKLIMDLYRTGGYPDLTPEEVAGMLNDEGFNFPITSIRRAITDLTDAGKLEKTNIKRMGIWNKLVHAWKLK